MRDKKSESQVEKFKRTARELGADEDEAEFDKNLRQVVKPAPKKDSPDK